MRIRNTDEREDRLRRLMEATGENTKSKAIDLACIHYLEDLRNKQEVIQELTDSQIDQLSTSALPIERQTDERVGPTEVQK